MLGDHGLLPKGCRFYAGLVHVPLILRWPGHLAAGATTDAMVELTDLVPTLLDAAGIDAAGPHGRPLAAAPAARHDSRAPRRRALRVLRGAEHGGARPHRVVQLTRHHDPRPALQAGGHGHPVGELFDLGNDAREHDNLWDSAEHAEVRFDLLRRCFDATAFAIDTGPEATRAH